MHLSVFYLTNIKLHSRAMVSDRPPEPHRSTVPLESTNQSLHHRAVDREPAAWIFTERRFTVDTRCGVELEISGYRCHVRAFQLELHVDNLWTRRRQHTYHGDCHVINHRITHSSSSSSSSPWPLSSFSSGSPLNGGFWTTNWYSWKIPEQLTGREIFQLTLSQFQYNNSQKILPKVKYSSSVYGAM